MDYRGNHDQIVYIYFYKKGSTPLIFSEKNGEGVLIHAHTTTRSKYYCRYASTLFSYTSKLYL